MSRISCGPVNPRLSAARQVRHPVRHTKLKLNYLNEKCSHTPRGRTTDRHHGHRDLLRLRRCRPQHSHYRGGELVPSTNNNVLLIRGRARYITFYIKMS